MTIQDDRLAAVMNAAMKVLEALPRAAENLDSAVESVEAYGVSAQSLERLADDFRSVVESLESSVLGKNLVAQDSTDPKGLVTTVERATDAIQAFVATVEASQSKALDEAVAFELGKVSGAAELVLSTIESSWLG